MLNLSYLYIPEICVVLFRLVTSGCRSVTNTQIIRLVALASLTSFSVWGCRIAGVAPTDIFG